MEIESSVLPTIDVENQNKMQYASHVHPLALCEINDAYCSICRQTCLGGRTYGCNQCGLFLHESCTKIEIPQEIDHYFHSHPLKLAMKEGKHLDFSCRSCGDSLPDLLFECRACKFYMDVECALLPTKLKQDGSTYIEHFKHYHPLMLCDDEEKINNNSCSVCRGGLSTRSCFSYDTSLLSEGSESIFGCLRCEFFLHEHCARLPLEIDSPFHPDHPLELINGYCNPICKGCDRRCVNDYMYECRDCCFTLGIECAFLTPILKFESHSHLLTLFPSINQCRERFPFIPLCHICNEACDGSNIFRCIDCDYNIHLHCGPLPCSIKDKCHIDPLKLMHAFVEDGYEDDTVYCDACEQPRDPDQCVYYCKDCNFFAEVKCVEAEVLLSLKGERGNVKLRTANKTRIRVGAKLIGYVTTVNVETDSSDSETEHIGAKYLEVELHENILSGCYTDEECEQVMEIFNKSRVRLLPSTSNLKERNKALCAHIEQSKKKSEISDEEFDNDENAIAERYSDAFKQVMRYLDSFYYEDEFLQMFFHTNYNIVRIGEHNIVQHASCDLASVLKGLLHKYYDFTAKSKLSQRLKAMFLAMFCEVIHSMCLTSVREVDQQMLHRWWKSLKLAQLAGFEIEFAIDHLYKVVQASFGMQTITSYHEKKSRVDKISDELEEEEAKLEAMKRELEAKIEAKKRELEELKSDVEKDKYAIEYQSSPVLKECFKHVSEFKWKKAWDASPIVFSLI